MKSLSLKLGAYALKANEMSFVFLRLSVRFLTSYSFAKPKLSALLVMRNPLAPVLPNPFFYGF